MIKFIFRQNKSSGKDFLSGDELGPIVRTSKMAHLSWRYIGVIGGGGNRGQ